MSGQAPVLVAPLQMEAETRQIGEELKGTLARLKTLAKDERAVQGPDVEALETAVINLDSAVEILTE